MVKEVSKKFISANSLYLYSLQLAKIIYDSGFVPNVLIALWRGGTPVGIVIHEFFRFSGKDIKFHKAVRTESYRGVNSKGKVKIEAFPNLMNHLDENSNLLIVDDIFDSGMTINGLLQIFKTYNKKPNIKIATVFYKPKKNQTDIVPDFYLKETDAWVVFPHELCDLTQEEIKKRSKRQYKLLKDRF